MRWFNIPSQTKETAVCVGSVLDVEKCMWDRYDNARNMPGVYACLA